MTRPLKSAKRPRMIHLATATPDFESAFSTLLGQARDTTATVDKAVTAIIADVRARGDAALFDYTARFDRFTATSLRITKMKSTPPPPAFRPSWRRHWTSPPRGSRLSTRRNFPPI